MAGERTDKERKQELEAQLAKIEEKLKRDPNDADSWRLKGAVLRDLKRYEEALGAAEKAIELNPEDHGSQFLMVSMLEHLHRHEEKLITAEKLIKLNPRDTFGWFVKMSALWDLKRYKEALIALEKIIELDYHVYNLQLLASYLLLLKRYKEALITVDKAIGLKVDEDYSWVLKGNVLQFLGRYEEAVIALDRAIELNPKSDFAWRLKREVLYRLGQLTEALKAVNKSIELAPTSNAPHNLKGVILVDCGRYEEALECFNLALEKEVNHAYLYNKGAVLARLKQYDEARDAIVRAREMVARPRDKTEKAALRCYDAALQKLRGAGERISWWDWWFSSESWLRRVLGGFLMVVVIACIVAPFIPEGRCSWFNCGQGWGIYIVPAAVSLLLLLLPVLRSFGTQGVELSPQLPERELERDIMEKYLKPKLG